MIAQGASLAQSPSSPSRRTAVTAVTAGGSAAFTPAAMDSLVDHQAGQRKSKRKAESQDNERLSKRLSLLNLEKNGPKLYVPVETPSTTPPIANQQPSSLTPDDSMQVDDSKHKVYIYNIDEELASDTESDDGKLVFLPDIEKHLKEKSRIPAHVLASSEGELAGMQVVLYSDPRSLTVPEENDSVRKAIIEARHRLRARLAQEQDGDIDVETRQEGSGQGDGQAVNGIIPQMAEDDGDDAMDVD